MNPICGSGQPVKEIFLEKRGARTYPHNLTEDEVLDAIEKAVRILAPGFAFGYYDQEDIEQEARILGLEALARYDGIRPLPNYIFVHVRNRLLNFRRDKFRRADPPCRACHSGCPCDEGAGTVCKKYSDWLKRNNAKANLMSPFELNSCGEHQHLDCQSCEQAEINDLLEKVDRLLPVELRSTYLQMRDGVAVPKHRRDEVVAALRELLGEDIEEDAS